MRAFGAQRPEIPLHVVIAKAVVGAALLAADEVLEFQRVADEEDRRVVADHVEIAVIGIELDREAARIAPGVGAAALARHGAEAHRDIGLGARLEELGLGIFRDVLGHLEMPEGARALGVWLALGDALSVEVGHLLDEVVVVEHDRAIAPERQRMLVALHRDAGVRGGARGVGECFGALGHGALFPFLTHRRYGRRGMIVPFSRSQKGEGCDRF